MIRFNVIYVYLHTNQTKYIILSPFIYFFYSFPLLLLYVALLFSFWFFLTSKGKGGGVVINLPPPPLDPPKFFVYLSVPPPTRTTSLMPINSALKRQCGNPVTNLWTDARWSAFWPDKNGIGLIADLVSSMHYQSNKQRKQIESGCWMNITNQRESVWNNFQYLKCKLTVTIKFEKGEG